MVIPRSICEVFHNYPINATIMENEKDISSNIKKNAKKFHV